jgi:hypothetical protein
LLSTHSGHEMQHFAWCAKWVKMGKRISSV